MNHDHTVSGMRIKVMPLARKSSVVVMKFNAPISDAKQKMAMLVIHRSAPSPSPGPADCTALSGGYPVHPCKGAPPETKNAAMMQTNATNVVQNESIFSTGNAISGAPI